MAKFFGKVGYIKSVEVKPSIWLPKTTAIDYYGDSLDFGSRWQKGDKINDDVIVTNVISIIADPFAYENFSAIKWVEWLSVKWRVESIKVVSPRIELTLGGVYNVVEE